MIDPEQKKIFFEALSEVPVIRVACKKAGIGRTSVYRLKVEDPEFRKNLQEAMKDGRKNIVDVAESRLFSAVEKDYPWAIKMVLESHAKRYYKPRKPMEAPPRKESQHITEFNVIFNGKKYKQSPENFEKIHKEFREETINPKDPNDSSKRPEDQ